jgi:hypothetical protein
VGCRLATRKHIDFCWSFVIVLVLRALTASLALTSRFFGAGGSARAPPADQAAGQGPHRDDRGQSPPAIGRGRENPLASAAAPVVSIF